MADPQKIEIVIVEGEHQTIFPNHNSAIDTANAGHRFNIYCRVKNITGEFCSDLERGFLNVTWQAANIAAESISSLNAFLIGRSRQNQSPL